MQRKVLGKGLEALLQSTVNSQEMEIKSISKRIITIPINEIIPNNNQSRENFSDEAMEELKNSIAFNGILEPPIVRRKGEYYELIAGERRFRAAKELNFDSIDVIIMDIESDEKMIILSLTENIQRENLNAIEEAKAYHEIMSRMGTTQEKLAEIVSKNRSTVANTMRLLSLPERLQRMVCDGILTPGSARALVTIEDRELQYKLALKISREGLSARKAEALVRRTLNKKQKDTTTQKGISPFVDAVREDIQRVLGTEVKIKGDEGKGKIEIAYYTHDDLERILETLKGGSLA